MPTAVKPDSTDEVSSRALKFRVMEFGVTSYWPRTFDAAQDIAKVVMARNGCGMIEERKADGQWEVTHRYEPWYGPVVNSAEHAQ